MQIGWPEVMTMLVTFSIVIIVVLMHYEGLTWIGRLIRKRAFHHRSKILVLIFAQLGLHFLEIWVFALGLFGLISDPDFGNVRSVADALGLQVLGLLDVVYFSAITYTTVGFGDFVPHGPIRFVCGMEALTGFVLITWSASFTFIEMQRYWGRD